MAIPEQERQERIPHFSHEHLFALIPESRMNDDIQSWCRACKRYFLPGEAAYGCSDICGDFVSLHKECLEMPRKIRHLVHPSHPLKQVDFYVHGKCAVCKDPNHWTWGYICSEGCELFIHLSCAVVDVENLDAGDEEVTMKHPSHTRHELRYLRRLGSFQCDACGTSDKGSWYGCSICQYLIHERCARLPHTASFPRRHHHPLFLAFCLPLEYIYYQYTCDVCKGGLRFNQWVYHCQLCRYVVHVKCATDTSPAATIDNEDELDCYVKFPIDEANEELIKPFVARERGIKNPHEDNRIINGKYQFHNHPHPLKLIMSSSSSSSSDDDDDDNEKQSGILKLQCDGCTMPIHEHKQRSYPNNYLSCEECKYFLHLVCFDLPRELSCLPVHSRMDHQLMLSYSDKLINWVWCNICYRSTNGLHYGCNKCNFKVDIKCAFLPGTIKHAAHPQPHHYLKLDMGNDMSSICAGCYGHIYRTKLSYRCDSCKFTVCKDCVLLPATNEHRSEKHLLSLTYDASVNHPSEFYCGECETIMNPKRWMYHCRDCDQSFHPRCFLATSGEYGIINFGSEEYMITPPHPQHPLKFQLITKKKYCDLCHGERYDMPGFQCASCNFAMCLFYCGIQYLKTMKVSDY